MMRVLFWLKDHWYLPLLAIALLGSLMLCLVFRTGATPADAKRALDSELEVIRAGAEARRLKAQLGAQQAAEEVRKQHAVAVLALNADQIKEAEALHHDPVALSRFLVRASRG